jgi:YHS domain-containing protein
MKRFLLSSFAVLLIATATVIAADVAPNDVDLEGVKCVVADKDANPSKSAEYKQGKVYFCCGGCAGKFAKTPKKFAAAANHQLVATKQYEQKACPFSGNDLDPEVSTTVAGTKIGFCCGRCKAKVEAVKDDKKALKLVFSEKAFEKAFKKVEKAE